MANLLSKVPRRAQPWVATMAQTIYQQPSPEEVHAQHSRMVGMLNERFPQAAVILEEAATVRIRQAAAIPGWDLT